MHVPVNFSSNDENQKECCVTEKNKARPACLSIKVVVLTKVQSFWFAQFHLKSDTTADMRQSVHPGTQCEPNHGFRGSHFDIQAINNFLYLSFNHIYNSRYNKKKKE